jgi:cellulose synthase (UDP-forming)
LSAGYLTRTHRQDAKAGNINAALSRTTGDIVVIFDIDHAPKPDFLIGTLGCFANPKVGFVQVMLTFANRPERWISEATAATSLDFYNPTSIGADGLRSATLIGSNALIRRKALESIQGYQPGLAEDLATSISLHAAGWQSVYIPEPLAPGIAPPDLVSWFTQQLKWSRGVFEILLTMFSSKFPQLRPGHQIMYAVRMTYYWIGLFTGAHVLLTIAVLLSGSAVDLTWFEKYLLHLAPLLGMTLLIRQLALRRWRHPSLGKMKLQWKPTILVFATWPIYMLSWFMAIFRIPLRFQPTPKTSTGSLHVVWVLPQIVTTMLLLTGLLFSLAVTKAVNVVVFGFALGQIVAQLSLLSDWLRPVRIAPSPSPDFSPSPHP